MKFANIVLLGASALLMLGCSSSPKDAVEGMFDAMSNGNIEKLQKYATESTAQLLMLGVAAKCKENPKKFSDKNDYFEKCMEDRFSKLSVEDIKILNQTDTKASVEVTENINGRKAKERLNVVKVNGDWKVSIAK